MDNKICVVCKIEKSIDNFYNNYRECKQCNIQPKNLVFFNQKFNFFSSFIISFTNQSTLS